MLIFDCDGVVLNSNKIKTEAFEILSMRYGKKASSELVNYHLQNGGVSRYKKFSYLVRNILEIDDDDLIFNLCAEFELLVTKKLLSCEINPNLRTLKRLTGSMPWMMITGSPQSEVTLLLKDIGIFDYFDNGIFGSPDTKSEIFERELKAGRILINSVYIGDSKGDFEAARKFSIPFIFFSPWSEVSDWQDFCKNNSIKHVFNLLEVIPAYKNLFNEAN